MLEELLNSKTRVKILTLFFADERKDYYAQEIVQQTKADAANIHRELTKLVKLGVLKSTTKDRRRYFKLNSASPFFRGLKALIEASGTRSPAAQGLKYLNDPDPWILGEDIPDMDLFFSQIWLSGFANEFEAHVGRMYKKVMCVYEGYHLWFYYGEHDSNEVGRHIVNRLLKDPAYAVRVNREIVRASDRLRAYADTLPENKLDKLTNDQLWKLWKTHDEIHTAYYQWGWIPVAADMFHSNLTNALINELRRRKVPAAKVNEYFAVLTSPSTKSLIQQEEEELLTIARDIQADPKHRKLFKDLYRIFTEQDASSMGGLAPHTPQYERMLEEKARTLRAHIAPKFLKLIEQHFEYYFYMKHMWIGKDGVYTFDHYLKELVKLIGRDSNAAIILREQAQDFQASLRKRQALMRQLKLTGPWKIIFDAFGDFMITKIYRRFAQIYAIYRMQPVIEETARRLKLTKMMARFMLTAEVGEALTKGKVNRAELQERTKFCAYFVERGREVIFTGPEAMRLAEQALPKDVGVVEEIKGQVGCVGKAKGLVKIVIRPGDMAKMNQGDVLVSIATDPDIVPAMKKAAAIVTEQGGVTSHAAIVSRELNIPCVIGTKIATKVLRDGDLVDVDAVQGIVKVIKRF